MLLSVIRVDFWGFILYLSVVGLDKYYLSSLIWFGVII